MINNKLLTTVLLAPALAPALTAEAKHIKSNKAADTERPNVIVILADDLGYGDLECYGARNIQTPNVNRLARHGIRFTAGHAVASTSTPSRYSLLTGEYAWRRPDTDIAPGNAAMIIRPHQFTMADMFKSAGYATCAIGKWHLGLGDKEGEQDWNAPLPEALGDIGFDYHYIMAATADRVPCVFIENGRVADYDPSAPIEVNYHRNFEGEPTGRSNPELLYNQRSSLWKDENIADSIVAHAVGFIKRHRDRPFFMYLATNDIHVPRFPHARFRGHNAMGLRGDAIAQFDWTVGQITQALDRLGLTDNTLIILTSDNGPVVDDGYADRAEELLNGHKPAGPFRGNKYSTFEGGTAVPLIVSWPRRVAQGRESGALVSQIDLMASLGSLVKAVFPKGSAPDSRDCLGTFLGENKTNRPFVIEQSNTRVLSVRTPQWKYIEPNDGPKMIPWGPKIETGNLATPQLYDMTASPFEQTNVAESHPRVVFELQNILRRAREGKGR